MRQLVELHDNLAAFEALDADIIAIAQREDDPANLERITKLVGDGITVVADPEGETRPLSLFGTFLIDGEGRMRRAIPGTKKARARLDVILAELADMTGKEAPFMTYDDGTMTVAGADVAFEAGEELSARWAFSHDRWGKGEVTKLWFLPEIAPDWKVYAPDTELMKPLSLSVELPEGLALVSDVRYPTPKAEHDELMEADLSWYEGDIPMDAFEFELADDFEGDEATVTVSVTYQACLGEMCLPPKTRSWDLTLPVGSAGERRGQLYNWETW
jgi:hypothetical protein